MAKRRAAEPLTFRVPWKRLLLSDFPEEPPLWGPPSGAARSRKRQGDAGIMAEPAPAPRKRRGCGDGGQEREGLGLEPGEPPPGEQEETRVGRAPGGGDAVGSADSPRGADGAPIQVGPPRSSPEPRPGLRKSGPPTRGAGPVARRRSARCKREGNVWFNGKCCRTCSRFSSSIHQLIEPGAGLAEGKGCRRVLRGPVNS
ncbi:Uncharacterized protein C9orf40-like [Cricetulus griseus]|uniref:Uncharacterized protein C9orf40-like n=1 Tax=Cricetulus griseus TaxID=10029 RepID=G3ILC1_CRIGR|nr:Uncharacterized protein C9orf40-like [Cricetulus griseus]